MWSSYLSQRLVVKDKDFLKGVHTMGEDIITALTTAFTGVKTDFVSVLAVALPAAVGIFAIGFGIKKAVGFFSKIANKS